MKERIRIHREIAKRTKRLTEIIGYAQVPDLSKGIPEFKILTKREEAHLMRLLDEIHEFQKELKQLSL